MLDPKVFLASVDRKVWIPLVVAVYEADRVLGWVCFKERKLAGLATGMVYGDATLGCVAGPVADRPEIFRIAVESLIRRRSIRAVRLLVPPESQELAVLNKIRQSMPVDLTYAEAENHCYLELGGCYESFLNRMGQKTRRNFRYYRRRFEPIGHFVPRMSREEFAQAVSELSQKSMMGADSDGIARACQIFSAVDRPLLTGLRHQDGRWMSVIGGWYESGSATVFLQLNDDRDHATNSLSLVMRAYLIEDLITAGCEKLLFWAGVGDPVRRYCLTVPTLKAFLDKRTLVWSSSRALLSSLALLFPARLKWAADWIDSAKDAV
jgi:hypothetical protein